MDKSNKIENLANKYVERHIRDRHLSDDTIKEIKIAYIMIIKDFIAIVDKSTSMNEDDIIYVVNNISSILYEPVEISNTDKKILEIGIALGLKGMGLCSECGRLATSPDGRDVVVPGKWHGKFPKKKATEEELKRVGYKNLIR